MIRTLRGTVVSDKMDKTVVVAVASVKEHPIYRKKFQVTTRFKAHDAENAYHTGDVVEISESRPLSAQKRWVVSKVLSTAPVEDRS
jgi:small subunit ribosomal protein S17